MVLGDTNRTDWIFPPALNSSFLQAYSGRLYHGNVTTGNFVLGLLSKAARDLTAAERVDGRFQPTAFGHNDNVLRVGDAIEPDWAEGTRNITLRCVVCTSGAEGGLVENACGNYTRSANMYTKSNISTPLTPRSIYILPSLEDWFPIKSKTCAFCALSLWAPEPNGWDVADYSVPFSVVQESAYPHKRFSAAHPTGIEDTNIPDFTVTTSPQPNYENNNSNLNVDMIVGVVVGVLMGTVLLGVGIWWMRRKRVSRKRAFDSTASSTVEHRADGTRDAAQDVALQHMQRVYRRPDSSASETPPPYTEAIQSKEVSEDA